MDSAERDACLKQTEDTLARLRHSSTRHPSRELSLAITKAQETLFWLREIEVKE